MAGGLLNSGRKTLDEAMYGMGVGAAENHKRNMLQKEIDQAEQESKQAVMTKGIGMGVDYLDEKGGGEILSRGITRGINAVGDALGNPMGLGITEGSASAVSSGAQVAADLAYDAAIDAGVAEAAAMEASNAALVSEAGSLAGGAAGAAGTAISSTMPWVAGAFLVAELF